MGRSLRSAAHQALIDELKAARAKAGLTQQAVADALGAPQSYIAKVEAGERRLDVIELLALTEALGGSWRAILTAVEKARRTETG